MLSDESTAWFIMNLLQTLIKQQAALRQDVIVSSAAVDVLCSIAKSADAHSNDAGRLPPLCCHLDYCCQSKHFSIFETAIGGALFRALGDDSDFAAGCLAWIN